MPDPPMSAEQSIGSPHGGGEQGEPVEGSLTDGGSLPGARREDRRFGAGRGRGPDAVKGCDDPSVAGAAASPRVFEGRGEDPGVADDAAEPGNEHSGYGETPPR